MAANVIYGRVSGVNWPYFLFQLVPAYHPPPLTVLLGLLAILSLAFAAYAARGITRRSVTSAERERR